MRTSPSSKLILDDHTNAADSSYPPAVLLRCKLIGRVA